MNAPARAALLAAAWLATAALSSCSRAPDPAPSLSGETVQGVATSFDGAEVAYTARGRGTEAVMLLHGWSCDRSIWDGTADDLVADYRVVTLDLPGHGASGSQRTSWTIEAFGEDVRAVADLLALDRVILVGHSMGGPVALEAARRLGDRVLGVVAVDALHDVDQPYDEGQWNAFLEMYRRDFVNTCSRFVVSMFGEDAEPALVVRTGEAMCEGANERIAVALLEQFPRYDRAAGLAAMQVPVRCINSTMIPTDWRGNQEVHRDFAVVLMQDVGHFPMLEAPEAFRRTLRETLAELVVR